MVAVTAFEPTPISTAGRELPGVIPVRENQHLGSYVIIRLMEALWIQFQFPLDVTQVVKLRQIKQGQVVADFLMVRAIEIMGIGDVGDGGARLCGYGPVGRFIFRQDGRHRRTMILRKRITIRNHQWINMI